MFAFSITHFLPHLTPMFLVYIFFFFLQHFLPKDSGIWRTSSLYDKLNIFEVFLPSLASLSPPSFKPFREDLFLLEQINNKDMNGTWN